MIDENVEPAAFGRLCVETTHSKRCEYNRDPAAFGRLCVETEDDGICCRHGQTSRLRAAVC